MPSALAKRAQRIHELLLEGYGEPTWRLHHPALDELVLTILSQNTSDVNSERAFDLLCAALPTWEAVRDAPAKKVIELIRPAGLANQKGPRIQNVLRQITQERGVLDLEFLRGMPVEESRAWLTRFNGVGPKTAAIVLLFSLGAAAFPVDTHVYRVTGRIGLRPDKMSVEEAHGHFELLFDPKTYYAAHLNIIRHGREVCHARNPKCDQCILRRKCDYYKNKG